MKKAIQFILFVILMNLEVYSQVKEKEVIETIEWINSKLVEHQFKTSNLKQIHILKEIKEVNGVYCLFGQHTQDSSLGFGFSQIFIIPIDKINSVNFTEKESNIWLEIKMKDNEKAILTSRDGKKWEQLDSFPFILSKSIDEENLRSRLKKSIYYLMELYGNTKNEKF